MQENLKQALKALKAKLPKALLLSEPGDCWAYGYDNSRKHHLPDAVVIAENQQHVVNTIEICNEYNIPVTARGRATGTTGGSIPIEGGVVLSLERMNKIIDFSPKNRTIEVEAGILNQAVQDAVSPQGFFWAPDPTSAPYCSVGGNLACNAGGPKAIKYGTTRDNVLGLTAITGDAKTITTGVYTTKGVVGYDLTRLLIGSEGTLGIITRATLKLLPLPETKQTLCALFENIEATVEAIVSIMSQSIIPCALEFIDSASIQMIRNHAGADLPENAKGMLLIEIDGSYASIDMDAQKLIQVTTNDGLLELKHAKTTDEIKELWKIRKSLSPALRSLSPHKINEDIVVPIANMPIFFKEIEAIGKKYNLPIVNFGHGGNGNIHVNILADPLDPEKGPIAHQALNDLFTLVLKLKGTLSGEHGVGIEKRDYVTQEIDPITLSLMQGIKKQFDPHSILNPGKMWR